VKALLALEDGQVLTGRAFSGPGEAGVEITSQNHGFAVDIDSIRDPEVELTHINLNDGTLEGLRHRRLRAFSVQYHPEASPGPHDAHYLFDEFFHLLYLIKSIKTLSI